MLRVFATAMAQAVIDDARQRVGAMGMTKELPLPLQLSAARVRNIRFYDGPSEVHRMAIARNIMNTHGK